MRRLLIVECMQEISSFNPLPSQYENFHIERGEELYAQRGLNTSIGGALECVRGRARYHARSRHQRARRKCRAAGGGGLAAALDGNLGRGRDQRLPVWTASMCRCTAPWGPTANSIPKGIF